MLNKLLIISFILVPNLLIAADTKNNKIDYSSYLICRNDDSIKSKEIVIEIKNGKLLSDARFISFLMKNNDLDLLKEIQ